MPGIRAGSPELDPQRQLDGSARGSRARAGCEWPDDPVLRGRGQPSLETRPAKSVTDRVQGRARIVALLAQMREHDVVQSHVDTLTCSSRGNPIAQMPEVAANAP